MSKKEKEKWLRFFIYASAVPMMIVYLLVFHLVWIPSINRGIQDGIIRI